MNSTKEDGSTLISGSVNFGKKQGSKTLRERNRKRGNFLLDPTNIQNSTKNTPNLHQTVKYNKNRQGDSPDDKTNLFSKTQPPFHMTQLPPEDNN